MKMYHIYPGKLWTRTIYDPLFVVLKNHWMRGLFYGSSGSTLFAVCSGLSYVFMVYIRAGTINRIIN